MSRCHHCDAESTKLCDFHIGQVIGEYVRNGAISANRWKAVTTMACVEKGLAFYTCDRPLCDACAVRVGQIFYCGTEGGIDTFDRCKDHAKEDDTDAPMITEDEAKRMRFNLHIRITPPRGKAELVK